MQLTDKCSNLNPKTYILIKKLIYFFNILIIELRQLFFELFDNSQRYHINDMIVPHLNSFNNFDNFLFILYNWIVSNFYYKKNLNTIDVTERDKSAQQTNELLIFKG
ncbi:hypothetical protein AABB24_026122 [Solanum stoloniferum]|uniref:Uncharacterized protein n=1 Tax=Solanum stoloniferum TaxID=62892 RepID=A0ABD2SDK7_9SOLN